MNSSLVLLFSIYPAVPETMSEAATLRWQDLYWQIVAELSASVSWLHNFWALGKANQCDREGVVEVTAHLMAVKKQKLKRGLGTRYIFQRYNLSDLLLMRPNLISPQAGAKPLHLAFREHSRFNYY